MFVYNQSLLLIGSISSILIAITIAIISVLALAIGFEGWLGTNLKKWQQIALVLVGLGLIYPNFVSYLILFVIFILVLLPNIKGFLKSNTIKLSNTKCDM